MGIRGKIQTFAMMMPVFEEDQLPNWNEPTSAKQVVRQGGLVNFLTPKEPISINENELTYKNACTTENGEENYTKINSEYKDRYKKGDEKAPLKLLERYPFFWFTNEPWLIKALQKKPVKSGRKSDSGKINRATLVALVNAFLEKGLSSEDKTFHVLSGRIGIKYDRIRDLYYDAKRGLIDKPFTVSSIPKSFNEGDRVEYTFHFFKPGIKIGLQEAKVINGNFK